MTPKHSNLGPSSADRWVNCPGSVAAVASLPSPPPSRAAAEGTVAHSLAEEFVTGKLSLKALEARIGRVTEESGFEIEVTQEMIEAVKLYGRIIAEDSRFIESVYLQAPIGMAEKRVVVSSISGELFGTADYVLFVLGEVLRIYDFKYGKKTVNPVENKQLAIYALGVLHELGPLDRKWAEIELVIVQPRAGGKPIRRWKIPDGWIQGFHEELSLAVTDTEKPDAILRAGAWCWWCAASTTCPEKQKERDRSAADDFA